MKTLTLQDALRSGLESSIIPAFEMSCKAMFEQIDTTFQKGLSKHTATAQQQLESTHSSLAIALRVCSYSMVLLFGVLILSNVLQFNIYRLTFIRALLFPDGISKTMNILLHCFMEYFASIS